MRSSRLALRGGARGQRGVGLVEVVVASGLMGVALVVLLTNLSTVVIGGRVAERRVVEERLARNQMEQLIRDNVCNPSSTIQPPPVDNIRYTVVRSCAHHSHYDEYTVNVADGSNAATNLVDYTWTATP